ncbi:hypothetical protein BaRGS_00013129 [Batillaria attramentaria]|uniref:Secreted protein n=1 Tax=Batillaria attramentaria TaxID=370345 RepID=A0ABD0L8I7_9CAEN
MQIPVSLCLILRHFQQHIQAAKSRCKPVTVPSLATFLNSHKSQSTGSHCDETEKRCAMNKAKYKSGNMLPSLNCQKSMIRFLSNQSITAFTQFMPVSTIIRSNPWNRKD